METLQKTTLGLSQTKTLGPFVTSCIFLFIALSYPQVSPKTRVLGIPARGIPRTCTVFPLHFSRERYNLCRRRKNEESFFRALSVLCLGGFGPSHCFFAFRFQLQSAVSGTSCVPNPLNCFEYSVVSDITGATP